MEIDKSNKMKFKAIWWTIEYDDSYSTINLWKKPQCYLSIWFSVPYWPKTSGPKWNSVQHSSSAHWYIVHRIPLNSVIRWQNVFYFLRFLSLSLAHSVWSFFYVKNFFALCQYNNDKTRLSLLLYPLTQNFVVYVAKTIWLFQSINDEAVFFFICV